MSELVKFKFYETALQANRDKQILAESGTIKTLSHLLLSLKLILWRNSSL